MSVSNQKRAAQRLKEDRDYMFLCLVADDVIVAIRKYIPSLDPMQGGLPDKDLVADTSVERIRQLVYRQPAYQRALIAIRRKRYEIGTRLGKPVYRSPTAADIREAVRFAAKELDYIRKEIIKEDPAQGIVRDPARDAARAIFALRMKPKNRWVKSKVMPVATQVENPWIRRRGIAKKVKDALEPPTLTARAKRKKVRFQ